MTPDEARALVKAIRDGESAEATLDARALDKIRAGYAARAALGRAMRPDRLYSPAASPPTVWMLDPATGLAAEVQPVPFEAPDATGGR
jgi:hypothetical protein